MVHGGGKKQPVSQCVPSLIPSEEGTKVQMKREIGLLEGVSIIIGIIFGSGIFISPTGVLKEAGSVGLSLTVWTLCGLLSMVGALCYAELGTCMPISGGDYAYIYECYGPFLSFLYLWGAMFILAPVGNAIMGLTFANYIIQPFFPACEVPDVASRLLAAAVICLLTFVNCWNVKLTAKMQNLFMFAKIAALAIIVVTGLIFLYTSNGKNLENMWVNTSKSPGQIALSFYSGIFCYSGWNYLNFITEELKDPYKNLPKAIYISLPLVTIIYVLANVAYLSVLTPGQMLSSDAIAVTFGNQILGVFSFIMPLMVAIAAFGGLSVHVMVSSRLCFVGARNGQFPSMLALINIEYYTPIASLVFLNILSLLALCTSDILLLITFSCFVESIFSIFSVGSIIYLRWKRPNMERPIKTPLWVPTLFVLITIFLVLLPCYVRPIETLTGVIATLTGIPVYYIGIVWKNKPTWFVKPLNKCTRFIQKSFLSVPEET